MLKAVTVNFFLRVFVNISSFLKFQLPSVVTDMGGNLQKMWQEMGEVEEAGKEREVKEKEGAKKIKLKDRLRTKILRGDPRYPFPFYF